MCTTSPRFCKSSFPRYSSLVPLPYILEVSTCGQVTISANVNGLERSSAYLVVPVGLEDVENLLDLPEVMHACACNGVKNEHTGKGLCL